MDAMKTLPIKKHITLVKRLPETRFASRIDLQRANWIIFADYLSPNHFDDIDFYTGTYNAVVATWKVVKYEVEFMTVELPSDPQNTLPAINTA